ncbi:protein NYNRIN-like [Stegodyphus dumicola]|uniref:protein NYNRIN-like n=1 Tax=Stegodyphus dumicola TaxID=202533 RepID=UPI0015B0FBE4|nr:protein NYNRIN-like [Stegodyphus dumicola]
MFHIDIVGPLPPSDGYRYLLTCIDRFTRWLEAFPIQDISADSVARQFITGWIARFGVPSVVTTDQGQQFQSHFFASLTSMLGIRRIRTSPYHSSANGLKERLHRDLKAALKCRNGTRWTTSLPLVLLGLRFSFKQDLAGTSAELVYGTHLRLPSEFFQPSSAPVDSASFVQTFRETMKKLSPIPTSCHNKSAPFVQRAEHLHSRVCAKQRGQTTTHFSIRWTLQGRCT